MRILIYGINYAPELTGVGKYSGEMADWLAAHGHEVRVVTAPPYYPAWKVAPGYAAGRYTTEAGGGVRVLRCPLWVPHKVTGLTRLAHLASFAISSALPVLWQGLRWRPDCVLTVEPTVFCAPAGWLAARLGGAMAWLHIQDFEIDAALDLGIIRSPRLGRMVLGLDNWLMRRFDRVSAISEMMIERLRTKGVDESSRCLFPNWADTDRIHPLDAASPMRGELGIADDDFVLLYSGNMGKKQGLEILVEAARRLEQDGGIRFVLCGDGAVRGELEEMAGALGNVRFLPLQPLDRLNDLANMADVHLLPQKGDIEDLVMPSRLTTMLASGRPVLATARQGTSVARVVERCGIVVEPEAVDAFVDGITRLRDDAGLRRRLGEAGRAWAVEHLGRDAILARAFGEPAGKFS